MGTRALDSGILQLPCASIVLGEIGVLRVMSGYIGLCDP